LARLGSWQWNLGTNESIWSEELYRIYGRSGAQGTPSIEHWLDHIHPDDREPLQTAIAEAIQGVKPYQIEYRLYRYDNGEERTVHAEGKVVKDEQGQPRFLIGTVQDITERKQFEAQLKASLQEKEVLLKEIHHRVKNNLTIVSSLLELQAETIQDEKARMILRESQARIYSMAHIHEHLYRSQNLARIDMSQYIRSLGEYLRLSYNANGITLATEVVDVALDIDTAIPCGLIVNELVSNSLKHAFPPGRNGSRPGSDEIQIKLRSGDEDDVYLLVRDNGVGLPPDLGWSHGSSLGLELVDRLTRQLRGRLEIEAGDGGTTFRITFAKPMVAHEEVKQ
jgi:two-component sensor histidine kinase